MSNIIFVCHGSICRSPAAMMILKMLSDKHIVKARALTYEEIGNDIYPPMKKELLKRGVPLEKHEAHYISFDDYNWADYIFYFDRENRFMLARRFGDSDKILPIFHFTNEVTEIEDPWYTGNYQKVVTQITTCVKDILKNI